MRGGGNNCKNNKCTLKIVDNKIGDINLNANNIVSFYYYEDIDTDKEPIKILMNLGGSEINYLQFGTVVIKSADKNVYKVNYTEPNHEGELENISKGINTPFFLNRIVAESFKLLATKPDKSFMKNAKTLKGFIEMVFPPTKNFFGSPVENAKAPKFYDAIDREFNDDIAIESNATESNATAPPITTPPITTPTITTPTITTQTITTPPIETELLDILKEEIKKKINLVNLNLDDTTDPNAVKIKEHLNQAGKYIAPFLQYQNIIQKLGLKLENPDLIPIPMLESLARLFKVYGPTTEESVVKSIKDINIGGVVKIYKKTEFEPFMTKFKDVAAEKDVHPFFNTDKMPDDAGEYFILVGVNIAMFNEKPIPLPVLLLSNGTYTTLNKVSFFGKIQPTPPKTPYTYIIFEKNTLGLPDTRLASTIYSRLTRKITATPDLATPVVPTQGGRRTKKQRKYRKYRK